MKNEIKHLEDQKVVGITGNCGFMMYYQCYARHVSDVPVFMSALIQAATMAAAMEPSERVLILTANAAMLQPEKTSCSWRAEFKWHVVRHLSFEVVKTWMVLRLSQMQNGWIPSEYKKRFATMSRRLFKKKIQAKADLSRWCFWSAQNFHIMQMPSDAGTRLPVFDAVTCVNYFYRAAGRPELECKGLSSTQSILLGQLHWGCSLFW